MDRYTRDLCYPEYTKGEIDAMLGPVFGCATLAVGSRPGSFTWAPSDCGVCEDPDIQYHWGNYKYRCCPKCWNVIKKAAVEVLGSHHQGEARELGLGFSHRTINTLIVWAVLARQLVETYARIQNLPGPNPLRLVAH